jgi:tRNA (mo5U34)-methyltransferase
MDMTSWSADALAAEVATRTWFHTIDLGNGVVTPGQKDTPTEVARMHLPDLRGRTVLDVGAYDGFYSFEAERQGASRVVAADSWSWNWPGSDGRRNFDLAKQVLGSSVEPVVVSVEELSPEAVGGTFDVVLFLGVLYHAPDPLGYLRNLRSVTGGVAVIETVVDMLDVPVPAAAYYPGASLNGDASNHFGPNPAAVEGLLHDAGFGEVVAFDPWWTNPEYAIQSYVDGDHGAHGDNGDEGDEGEPPVDSRWRYWSSRVRRVIRRQVTRRRSGRMVFHAHP